MSSPPAVAADAQLEWEGRVGRLAAAAAFLSAALAAASMAIQPAFIGAPPESEREALVLFDEHQGEFLAGLVMQVASYALLAAAMLYLLRVAMHRRPEVPRFTTGLLLLAPVLLAVGGILDRLELNDVAEEFLTSGNRTEPRADDLLEDRDVVGAAIAQGGTLCLALSFVLISLNAMRAGLLSRFMGVLGIVVGALLILPLLPGGQSTVQIFWVTALGLLFLDRWPGGRGPAWETGEPIPWPSAADAREKALAEAAPPEDEAPAEPEAEEEAPRPVSRKRKRKRRG